MKPDTKEIAFGAGLLVLIAIGIGRLLGPDRPRMRPVSIEALEIPGEIVGPGQTLTREAHWQPPDDIYVIGWLPHAGAPHAEPELMLHVGDLRIFETRWPAPAGMFLPSGSGVLVRKGQVLTMRFRFVNSGPEADTHGASALVYFVPVAGS